MPPIHVQLGNVEFDFEPESGFLRYVRVGSHELMRGIYGAVRDANWQTPVNKISGLKVTAGSDKWNASWTALATLGDVSFEWEGNVRAKTNGDSIEIEFEFEGVAKSTFKSNRTGICVLHPRLHRGLKCEIEHNHGECQAAEFPLNIKPDQPFKDVKAISLDVAPGINTRTEFFGEVFETEDQRNYGDASFKTYSRPQEWEKPFTIGTGEKISQRVKLTIQVTTAVPEVSLRQTSCTLPRLGTLVTRALSESEVQSLKLLGADCWLASHDGLAQAKELGGPVFLATQAASLPALLSPSDGICLSPPDAWLRLNNFRGAQRLATATWTFMQLNGARPAFDEIEGSAWPMQPCIHLKDDLTALEGGWTIEDQVKTAKSFGSKVNLVGPIEPFASQTDERISSLETALFTLTAIAGAAKGGANFAMCMDAPRLMNSPAALIFELLKDASREIEIFEFEPFFLMLRSDRTILANLSWEASDLYKLCPIDRPENLANGIRNAYRLFTNENVSDWRKVLNGPESHNPLTMIPPRSIVVM